MSDLTLIKSENFGNVQCDFWKDDNGNILMTSEQLGRALGYSDPARGISKLVSRNDYLKNMEFSSLVSMTTEAGIRETRVFTEDGIYEVTFLANTEKAKQFRAWVRKILKSLRKGETVLIPKIELKKLEIEARLRNARTRQARLMVKMAEEFKNKLSAKSIQILVAGATEILTGVPMIEKPKTEKLYTATDIARELGISANKVGRIATKNNLKDMSGKYGIWVLDKSPNSSKQVNTFLYNEVGREKIKELFNEEGVGDRNAR